MDRSYIESEKDQQKIDYGSCSLILMIFIWLIMNYINHLIGEPDFRWEFLLL